MPFSVRGLLFRIFGIKFQCQSFITFSFPTQETLHNKRTLCFLNRMSSYFFLILLVSRDKETERLVWEQMFKAVIT